MEFTKDHQQQALEKIRELRKQQPTNWDIPTAYAAKAFEIAETARESPAQALFEARNLIESLRQRNIGRQVTLAKARKFRNDLIALEEQRGPRKRTKTPRDSGPKTQGRFARWLNGLSNKPTEEDAQEKNDDGANKKEDEQAGESAQEGTAATEGTTVAGSGGKEVAKAQPPSGQQIAQKRERRGCFGLFLPRRAKIIDESPDPTDHGIPLPLTNAGTRGWKGLLQRWLLAWLNATPTSGLNWMEVTKDGLQIYQPLATVSQRAIKHNQLRDGQVVLSVNPPAYFDSLLGVLRQFRRDIDTPWGEIVIYEGGSGRVIASAIALSPGPKLRQIRAALELLYLANNETEGFQRIPQLSDLLIYVDDGILDMEL